MQQEVISLTLIRIIRKISADAEITKHFHDFSVLKQNSKVLKAFEKYFVNLETFPGF